MARYVPADRLLVETDAPYLAPVPFRGKTNQPAYVRHVAEAVAAARGETLEAVAEVTTRNFFRLFKDARPVTKPSFRISSPPAGRACRAAPVHAARAAGVGCIA